MSQSRFSCKNYVASKVVQNPEIFARQSATSVCYNGCVYLFGGISQGQCQASIAVFDLNTKETSQIQLDDGPAPRYAHASCLVGDALYVFGGIGADGAYLNDIWLFNLNQQVWTQLQPSQQCEAMAYHCMAQCSENELLIGCGKLAGNRYNQNYYLFRISDATITRINTQGDRPASVVGAAMVSTPRGVYQIGGLTDGQQCTPDVWQFTGRRFNRVGSHKEMLPVAFHAAVLIDEINILVFGGTRTPSCKSVQNEFQNFSIEAKQWYTISGEGNTERPSRRQKCVTAPYWTRNGKTKLLICGGSDETEKELQDMWSVTFIDCYGHASEKHQEDQVQESQATLSRSINILEQKDTQLTQKSEQLANQLDAHEEKSRTSVGEIATIQNQNQECMQKLQQLENAQALLKVQQQQLMSNYEQMQKESRALNEASVVDFAKQGKMLLAETQSQSLADGVQCIVEQTIAQKIAQNDIQIKLEAIQKQTMESSAELVVKIQDVKEKMEYKVQALIEQLETRINEKYIETQNVVKTIQLDMKSLRAQQAALKEALERIDTGQMRKTVHFGTDSAEKDKIVSSFLQNNGGDDVIGGYAQKTELDIEQLGDPIQKFENDQHLEQQLKQANLHVKHIQSSRSDYSIIAMSKSWFAASNGKVVDRYSSTTLQLTNSDSFDGQVTALAFCDTNLVVGLADGTLYFGKTVKRIDVSHAISCIHVDGGVVYAGTDGGALYRINPSTLDFNLISQTPEECGVSPRITAIDSNQGFLVWGDQAGAARRMALADKAQPELLYRHQGAISGIAHLREEVVSVSNDKTMRIWNHDNGKQQVSAANQLEFTALAGVGTLAFSTDRNGLLRMWDCRSKVACIKSFKFSKAIDAMRFSCDTFLLVVGDSLHFGYLK